MATWQFTFELIPEEWSKKENYSNKKLLNNEYDFDTEVSWKEYQTSKDIILQVKKILPTSNKSYNEDLVHFGDFSSNDIQVWIEDKKIYGIQIRLDLRNFDINLIDKIIYFSKKFKYSFFIVESKKLIPQNRDILISSIKDSSAYKFVKNPTDFFDNIS